jgi:hypothetical protein
MRVCVCVHKFHKNTGALPSLGSELVLTDVQVHEALGTRGKMVSCPWCPGKGTTCTPAEPGPDAQTGCVGLPVGYPWVRAVFLIPHTASCPGAGGWTGMLILGVVVVFCTGVLFLRGDRYPHSRHNWPS